MATGQVHVWRGEIDAEELTAIRRGEWSYERLLEEATMENERLEELWRTGAHVVPSTPDRTALDALVVEITEAALRS